MRLTVRCRLRGTASLSVSRRDYLAIRGTQLIVLSIRISSALVTPRIHCNHPSPNRAGMDGEYGISRKREVVGVEASFASSVSAV